MEMIKDLEDPNSRISDLVKKWTKILDVRILIVLMKLIG